MGFIDKRKNRQKQMGRYKNTDFASLAEARSFAMVGPLPERFVVEIDYIDRVTQGITLHSLGLHGEEYFEAMKILKRTFTTGNTE